MPCRWAVRISRPTRLRPTHTPRPSRNSACPAASRRSHARRHEFADGLGQHRVLAHARRRIGLAATPLIETPRGTPPGAGRRTGSGSAPSPLRRTRTSLPGKDVLAREGGRDSREEITLHSFRRKAVQLGHDAFHIGESLSATNIRRGSTTPFATKGPTLGEAAEEVRLEPDRMSSRTGDCGRMRWCRGRVWAASGPRAPRTVREAPRTTVLY